MNNILTLEEALQTIKTDNDYDGEVQNALGGIDAQIFSATGVRWQTIDIEDASDAEKDGSSLAKDLARIKLRLMLDYSTNPQQDRDRETYITKQLQAISLFISSKDEDSSNGGSNSGIDRVFVSWRDTTFEERMSEVDKKISDIAVGGDGEQILALIRKVEEIEAQKSEVLEAISKALMLTGGTMTGQLSVNNNILCFGLMGINGVRLQSSWTSRTLTMPETEGVLATEQFVRDEISKALAR